MNLALVTEAAYNLFIVTQATKLAKKDIKALNKRI
jgi:hypothetical protein